MRISDWSSDVCSSDLRAKGYYSARVTSEILPGNAGARLQVVLDAEPGAQYLVNTVSLPGLEKASENQSALREAFPVKKGDPVDADKNVAAHLELAVARDRKRVV